MHSPNRLLSILAGLGLVLLACPAALAQEVPPSLRLDGVRLGGARTTVSEFWGTFEFTVTNPTDTDRRGLVLVAFADRLDVQYGREVWVPARASITAWMLAGPVPPPGGAGKPPPGGREVRILFRDRTDGRDHNLLRPGQERIDSRLIPYRARDPYTAVLLDDRAPEEEVFGRLPRPPAPDDETVVLARVFRLTSNLSEKVQIVKSGPLPSVPAALDGVEHFVLASGRIARDAAGLRALRRWLQDGGRLWALLDRVDPAVLAPLLGDALDFEVVDRVSLTRFAIEAQPLREPPAQVQEHAHPVDFVRVLLPAGERVRDTVNGWPAWFARPVGRGRVVFTTLGARGWFRERGARERRAAYAGFPDLPVPLEPLESVARELVPAAARFPDDAFKAPLAAEVGYEVVGRGTVALVLGAFLAATLGLGIVLRRSGRAEWLGWLGPAAAVGAAVTFLALGEAARRAVPPTVAVVQVVDVLPGSEEAPVRGMLAVYRPESGAVEAGTRDGGLFELDMSGIEGQTRRLVTTDLDAWHWENLAAPAGVRFAPFRHTARFAPPVVAAARFGPGGVEGRLEPGPFRDVGDAILSTAGGRTLSVRLRPDGTFRAGSDDVLPPGLYLAGGLLSDRQQRRQELYRELFRRPGPAQPDGSSALLAWAGPVDTGFTLAPGARSLGDALLIIPLRLERPEAGVSVTIPGPLVPYRRILLGSPSRPTREARQAVDMHLRFQLPASVLPFRVERARLVVKADAPSRRVTIAGRAGDEVVEVRRADSPLDPVRVDITAARLLALDDEGGLHLNLAVSDLLAGAARRADPRVEDKWTIEYLELEVTGRAAP